MIYPVFLQDLRIAVNQTVLPCVVVSKPGQGRIRYVRAYLVRIYEDRFASILTGQRAEKSHHDPDPLHFPKGHRRR